MVIGSCTRYFDRTLRLFVIKTKVLGCAIADELLINVRVVSVRVRVCDGAPRICVVASRFDI